MASHDARCCSCYTSLTPPFRHNICFGNFKGLDHLIIPRLNKGTSFTLEERMLLGIHGYIPANYHTIDDQISTCLEALEVYKSRIAKFIYLLQLRFSNEVLFFQLSFANLSTIMPLIYTPTLYEASLKFHLFFGNWRGLYISINDKGYIRHMLLNWPEELVRGVIVSDGESVLGLGDIGCNSMAVILSKSILFTVYGQIPPHLLVPIVLDVGINNCKLRQDPKYCGLKQKRVRGRRYYEFLDEFMDALISRWGPNIIVHMENFHSINSLIVLKKFKYSSCIINDGLQGIPAVSIAALISALQTDELKDKSQLKDHTILFMGAGQVALGIAHYLVKMLMKEGLSEYMALNKIWMFDSKGLIVKSRIDLQNTGRAKYAKDFTPIYNFQDALYEICPTILFGVSKVKGAFTKDILATLGEYSEAPIIFTISCPTENVECSSYEAYENTNGRALYASSVHYESFEFESREYSSSQIHSNYIFPGVMLASVAGRIRRITNKMIMDCAQTVADLTTQEERRLGFLLPSITRMHEISLGVATTFLDLAYRNNLAELVPEPENKAEFLYNFTYKGEYPRSLPPVWD